MKLLRRFDDRKPKTRSTRLTEYFFRALAVTFILTCIGALLNILDFHQASIVTYLITAVSFVTAAVLAFLLDAEMNREIKEESQGDSTT